MAMLATTAVIAALWALSSVVKSSASRSRSSSADATSRRQLPVPEGELGDHRQRSLDLAIGRVGFVEEVELPVADRGRVLGNSAVAQGGADQEGVGLPAQVLRLTERAPRSRRSPRRPAGSRAPKPGRAGRRRSAARGTSRTSGRGRTGNSFGGSGGLVGAEVEVSVVMVGADVRTARSAAHRQRHVPAARRQAPPPASSTECSADTSLTMSETIYGTDSHPPANQPGRRVDFASNRAAASKR